jgi:hypothetical protein
VDSLYVEIDNLNNLLVGFCFIKSIARAFFTSEEKRLTTNLRVRTGALQPWHGLTGDVVRSLTRLSLQVGAGRPRRRFANPAYLYLWGATF